jgi:mannose-6-phosphate isomerase-like protein (cupin superfamily)
MSYPPPVYHGTEGKVSATFRPADADADIAYASGGTAHYLATGATTGGKFGLYRWNMSAQPTGPGPHFHRTMTESFFVIDGIVRIFNGDRWIDARPGDFVHVPEGGLHGFRNESGAPASMLILFSPGAPREGYFEGLPELAGKSEEEKLAFYLEHDNYWV